MLRFEDILQILGIIALVVVMTVVIRLRRRGKTTHDVSYAAEHVCQHLKPALDALLARGLIVTQVGQRAREFPLEIHFSDTFDPAALYAKLKLEPPAQVSERNVLFCKDDWCELHPRK